ncbi:MAG TPA: diguanylate cyclase, partial [Gammaproteobacteria bacterium]
PELGRLLQRSLATQEETLVSFDLLPRKVYLDEDPARFDGLPPQVLTQAVAAPVRGAGVLIGLFALERAGWLAERLQGLLTLDNTFVALLQGDRLLATVPIAQNLWAADRPIGNHLERAIRAGQLFKGRLPFGEDGGLVVSEPLFNTDFQPVAALALAVDSARISQYVREHSRNIYLAMALGIGLSMLIAYLAYRDTITPLQAIVNAQHDFAAGNYGVRTEIETKDEFERLGAGFNRMADAVEAHDRRLEQYNALSSLVNLSISPEALLQGTLDRVIEISRSQLGAIYLLDEGSNRLAPLVAHGLDLEKIGTIKLGEGLPGQAALEKVVKRVTEVPESGALDYKVGIASLPPQELVYFPLIYRGELIGLLLLGSLSHFPEDEFVLLEHLSRQAAIILNDTVAQKRIRDLGVRDSLTGVNNRTHFTARLEQAWGEATRYGSQLAVLMVDIDHFRQIAERYGYHLADNVLIAVARSLRKSVRKSDLVARFGENRFSVLLPHSDTEQAVATAEKVRKNIIGTTVPQLERERITISIGVASYPEIPVQSPIELVRKANAALTDAKSGGRNRVVNA